MSNPCSMTNRHSSPVPVIGLYIAGTSLVCLLLIICDVLFSIKRKAYYIPCRFFSLNSVTLSLLAIVSKLPVDLTSNMPSSKDQLSKLTGTTLACVYISFMAPSVASSRESESIANMAALTIFVVTVAVNICIQIATGVIFAFIVEHIIILSCLFALLAIFWYNTFDFNAQKEALSMQNTAIFLNLEEVERCFMNRVKKWYIASCINNPQLLLCRAPLSSGIGPICITCAVVLLQAAYRSIVARSLVFSCEEVSDYGWSVQIIVMSQIVAIIIGALTIAIRWLVGVLQLDMDRAVALTDELQDLKLHFLFMTRKSMKTSIMVLYRILIKSVLVVILFLIHAPVLAIPFIINKISGGRIGEISCCMPKAIYGVIPEFIFKDFLRRRPNILSEWMIQLCVKAIDKWMNAKRDIDLSSGHMVQMLSIRRPDDLSTSTRLNELVEWTKIGKERYTVTCLTMVLLVKLGVATAPSTLTQPMRDTLSEAFKIIYYIDKKMNVGYTESRKRRLAKFILERGDIDISKKVSFDNPNDPVSCAISNIESASHILPHQHLLEDDMALIRCFITLRDYTTIEEFCKCMEQLFSEMLHSFLTQLPNCIFKEVKEVPSEECEARARLITKLICEELDLNLEDKVDWIIPAECRYVRHVICLP